MKFSKFTHRFELDEIKSSMTGHHLKFEESFIDRGEIHSILLIQFFDNLHRNFGRKAEERGLKL